MMASRMRSIALATRRIQKPAGPPKVGVAAFLGRETPHSAQKAAVAGLKAWQPGQILRPVAEVLAAGEGREAGLVRSAPQCWQKRATAGLGV